MTLAQKKAVLTQILKGTHCIVDKSLLTEAQVATLEGHLGESLDARFSLTVTRIVDGEEEESQQEMYCGELKESTDGDKFFIDRDSLANYEDGDEKLIEYQGKDLITL